MALGLANPATTVQGGFLIFGNLQFHNHGPIPAGTLIDTISWNLNFTAVNAALTLSPVITTSDSADIAAHAAGVSLVTSNLNLLNTRPALLFQAFDLAQAPIIGSIRTDWPIETASTFLLIALENVLAGAFWSIFTNVTYKKLPGFNP